VGVGEEANCYADVEEGEGEDGGEGPGEKARVQILRAGADGGLGRVWERAKETVAWCRAMMRVRLRAKSMPVGEAARYIAHDSVFWEITFGLGWRKASCRR
jgi:hypothetical protein